MPIKEVYFLILVISALSLFGGVLAWACWDERRVKRKLRN